MQYLLPVGPTAARSSPSTLGSMRAISRTETTATGHVSSTHRHARRLEMQDEPLASRGMASCQEKTWPWPPPCTSTAIRSQMGWFGAPTLCVVHIDECITYRLCNALSNSTRSATLAYPHPERGMRSARCAAHCVLCSGGQRGSGPQHVSGPPPSRTTAPLPNRHSRDSPSLPPESSRVAVRLELMLTHEYR